MSEVCRSGGVRRRGILRAFSKSAALKSFLLSGASLTVAVGLSGAAFAQTSEAPEEVVVTGTQVLRNGYSAPTPLRVVGTDDINANAPTNLSDYLVKLPALAGSTGPRSSGNSVSDGNGGVAGLNIRKLGNNRTLVLFDGMRIGPSSESGASTAGEVDINELPDPLIKRIDIVTGGASAQYGSDALAGVVNFILDKDFTGVKGTLQGGLTIYGDDPQANGSLTAGFGFMGGHGHVLLSGSVSHTDGILHGSSRSWVTNGAWDMVNTPGYTATNGKPFYTVAQHVGSGIYTPGGLIGNTALQGIDFGPNGSTRQFNYGALTTGNNFMIGGDYQETYPALTDSGEQYTTSLDDRLDRQNFFGRVSYDFNDHLEVFADVLYSNAQVLSYCCTSGQVITIKSGNPFIPSSVQSRMTALGIPSFTLGQLNTDIGATGPANQRQKEYFAAGASGDFDMLGSNWRWNFYGSASSAQIEDRAVNSPVVARYQQATNVVTGPNGVPICASTVTNPTDGCIPYNPMGVGVNTPTAIAYALQGTSQMHTEIAQEVVGGALRSNPFDLWAGPVSFATGIEHRQESVNGVSTATDMANGFFLGNYHPAIGGVTVTEGFVETVIPLASDYSWAKEFDLDLAVRETGYSSSGNVLTYKAGLVYDAPQGFLEGLRLRATRSRDIRAPSLGDLYSGGRVGQGSITDYLTTPPKTIANVLSPTLGNPNLKPEVAVQTGVGAVYSPTWIPGFNASVDLFQVQMNNAISSLSSQNVVIACYVNHVTAYCPFIQRDATGTLSIVTSTAANTAYQKEAGVDLEASYQADLADFSDALSGTMSLHALATNIWQQTSIDPLGNITRNAGSNSGGVPHWSYNLSATYDAGRYAITWVGRGLGSGVRSRQYTQCTAGCPNLTAPLFTINDNYMPGAFYMDLTLTYRLKSENLGDSELFFNVENLTNNNPTSFFVGNSNPLYDRLGAVFHGGFRFKM